MIFHRAVDTAGNPEPWQGPSPLLRYHAREIEGIVAEANPGTIAGLLSSWNAPQLRLARRFLLAADLSRRTLPTAYERREVSNSLVTMGFHVLDRADGMELVGVPGGGAAVTAVAVSPDSHMVAWAGIDGTADHFLRWNHLTDGSWVGEHRITNEGAAERITALVWTKDGRHVVSGSSGGNLMVWDPRTGRPVRTKGASPLCTGEPDCAGGPGVDAMAALGDGRVIYGVKTSAGRDGAGILQEEHHLWILDPATGETQQVPGPAHTLLITALAVAGDPELVASAGYDGRVFLRRTDSGELLWEGEGEPDPDGMSAALSPDGSRLAFGGEGIEVRHTDDGRLIGHHGGIAARWLRFTADGTDLVAAAGRSLSRVDPVSGREKPFDWNYEAVVGAFDLSGDGQFLVTGDGMHPLTGAGVAGNLRLWYTGKLPQMAEPLPAGGDISTLALSPDGGLLAEFQGSELMVRRTSDGIRLPAVWYGGGQPDMAFTADGSTLIVKSGISLYFLDPLSLKEKFSPVAGVYPTAEDHAGAMVASFSHSSGSGLLAVGYSNSHRIRIFDLNEPDHPLISEPPFDPQPSHQDFSIAFSPDGNRLISVGYRDGAARILDRRSGQETLVPGAFGLRPLVRMRPDGLEFVMTSGDSRRYFSGRTEDGRQHKLIGELPGPEVCDLVYSGDSRRLLVAVKGDDFRQVLTFADPLRHTPVGPPVFRGTTICARNRYALTAEGETLYLIDNFRVKKLSLRVERIRAAICDLIRPWLRENSLFAPGEKNLCD